MRRDLDWLVAEDRGAQLERCVALEWPASCRHFVQHHSERPEVAGDLHVLPAQLLGRHVRERSHGHSRLRQRRVDLRDRGRHVRIDGPLGETEVQNLDAPIRRDDDVVALQVAMHDATLVRVRECVGELPSVMHDIVRRHRSREKHRAERLPLHELHRDVGLPIGFADFVHRADVGTIQGRSGACFPRQSRARRGIVEARGRKDLDGNVSIELLITGPIHFAHATSAEPADDAIVRQPPPIHGGFWAAFYPVSGLDACVAPGLGAPRGGDEEVDSGRRSQRSRRCSEGAHRARRGRSTWRTISGMTALHYGVQRGRSGPARPSDHARIATCDRVAARIRPISCTPRSIATSI